MPKFHVGQRVGILVGVQSVDGPHVDRIGHVVRTQEFWKGSVEYVVKTEGGTELVYPAYLLQDAS